MSGAALLPLAQLAMIAGCAGFALGLAYFAMLRRTVASLATRRGWMRPLSLTLGRIAAAVILFAGAAKLGAAALLAAFLGFLAARALALGAARRAG